MRRPRPGISVHPGMIHTPMTEQYAQAGEGDYPNTPMGRPSTAVGPPVRP
ncbi:hypothetical protein [Embleya sp. NBC_00896]